jgi:hypothetical protein
MRGFSAIECKKKAEAYFATATEKSGKKAKRKGKSTVHRKKRRDSLMLQQNDLFAMVISHHRKDLLLTVTVRQRSDETQCETYLFVLCFLKKKLTTMKETNSRDERNCDDTSNETNPV